MPAVELRILAKNRSRSATPAHLSDFDYAEAATASPERLLKDPALTLYCLDDAGKQAVFVRTPDDVDLYARPFLYQAQYEHAQALFTLPFETLHALAKTVAEPRLILLYSVGRCGSTLLSNAFGELDTVLSLSEPDVFMNLTGLRERTGERDAELSALTENCTKLLCKPSRRKTPERWLIKFRGFSVEIADLVCRAFPDADNLFLYRDAETWAQSMARLTRLLERGGLEREPLRSELYGYPFDRFVSYLRRLDEPPDFSVLENFALGWLSMMNRYLEHYQSGVPFAALRYADLSREPDATLEAVFEYCGLDRADIARAKQAFAQDSQAGTRFSGQANRDSGTPELQERHLEQVRTVLERHPDLDHPDPLLPGTLLP